MATKKSVKKPAKKAAKKPVKKTNKPTVQPVAKKPFKPIKTVSEQQKATSEVEATTTDEPVVKAVLDPSGAIVMAPVEYKS